MEILKPEMEHFPHNELLEYSLKMMGAKGSIRAASKKAQENVELKCQVLASLLFPPKKIVDSEITTKLEKNTKTGMLQLLRYIDNDFKSESRRQLEIKNHGIESRYTKFDEERGFIELPEGIKESELVDPLSLPFLIRDKRILYKNQALKAHLLTRTGVLNLELVPSEKRRAHVQALGVEREQIRIRAELKSGKLLKGPYLSPDLEVWVDSELGIIVEMAYPFLGHLGKAVLHLENYKKT